jgi:hypothetical protein
VTAINFPDNPQIGDAFLNFAYDGEKWRNAGSRTNAVVFKDLFEFNIAADDSTQRLINSGENIKFVGAGTVTTASDAEGNITITGAATNLTGYATETFVTTRGYLTSVGTISYNDLTDKPNLAGTYTFNVAADDSTLRTISSQETVKFIGAGGITTASDAEGAITITQGSTDQIIKVAGSFASEQPFKSEVISNLTDGVTINTWMGLPQFATTKSWKFGYNGNLTFPDTTVQTTAYTGNAATATSAGTLTTARNINGVSFNGSADITVTAAAGTLTGNTLASGVTASSLTSVGTLGSLTVQGGAGTYYAARFKGSTGGDQFAIGLSSTAGYGAGNDVLNSAGTAYAPYTISASTMTFKTGSSLPTTAFSIDLFGTVTFNNTVTGSVSGNAGTATSAATLTTARNINGVSFNGSAAINIPTLTDGTNLIKITAVPSALTGGSGDVVGSVAFDSTYIYYCFQAFTGVSYSLPILSGGGLTQVTVNAGNSQTRIAIVAAFAATPAGWSYGGAPVTNITGSNQTIVITMSSGYSSFGNGTSYTLIQPPASANWKTTPWGAITSAAAESLTGNTLASGVTASSLTSFGTTPAMTSPAITTSLTTPSTSFDLINTTATTVNFAGAATTLSVGASTGTTTVNNNLSMASGKTIGTTATVTSNHTTAFSAGDSAISNVALSVPRNAAIRDRTNGASVIYFDVSNGGTTNGEFQFRSSSAFTNVLTMNTTAFNVNTNAVVTARTPSLARLAWNSAMGTELTVDNMRFRITNSGLAGIFPQVIGNGSTRNLAWTVVAARSGSAVTQAGSTGTIVADNAWTTLYNLGGMDSSGDTFTATLQDKGAGTIYRVTFMRSDSGGDGFNIIAERLL